MPALIRVVSPVSRSCAYASRQPFVSPGAKLDAADVNVMYRPLSLMEGPIIEGLPGLPLQPLPCAPSLRRLALSVVPACRSRTKTSTSPLESPSTRFEDPDAKAT